MSATLIAAMVLLGAVGGFVAGLLGFGGGVLMFPLLYYVPPLLGLERLDAQMVTAVVISQVFFSTLVGGLAHLRSGRVQGHLAILAGTVSAVGSFAGAVASKWASEQFLLLLFGIVTLLVLLMMALPGPGREQDEGSREKPAVPMFPLACCSVATGVVIGFLGAGNFVFVPLLIYVFKVPTRAAIGSTLFIALMNTASGFAGKLVTGQIPLIAVFVICGAAFGAWAGEIAHRRVPTRVLRLVYAAMVLLIAVRVWLTILGITT
jgi:uncharacterized membrane protein YfcA